jgi:hypothetical protein
MKCKITILTYTAPTKKINVRHTIVNEQRLRRPYSTIVYDRGIRPSYCGVFHRIRSYTIVAPRPGNIQLVRLHQIDVLMINYRYENSNELNVRLVAIKSKFIFFIFILDSKFDRPYRTSTVVNDRIQRNTTVYM